MPLKREKAPRLVNLDPFFGPFNPDQFQCNALYPYLALSFRPTVTKHDSEAALRALTNSINSATALIQDKPLPKENLITVAKLKAHLNKLFNNAVADVRTLDFGDLKLVLGCVNQELGTNFELGLIREGFLRRWDEIAKEWNLNDPEETEIKLEVEDPGCAVIWIWNDNAEARSKAQAPHSVAAQDHWEGFTIPTRKSDKAVQLRDRMVRECWLGSTNDHIDDFKNGVWIATRDCEGIELDDRPILEVSAGHFLRQYNDPEYVDTLGIDRDAFDDHEYFKNCDEMLKGLVENINYRKLRGPGPEECDDPTSNDRDSPDLYKPSERNTLAKTTGSYARSKPNGKAKSGTGENKKTIARGEGKVTVKVVVESNTSSEYEVLIPISFQIFRIIEATNKVGEPLVGSSDSAAELISGFSRPVGHFLLDNLARPDDAPYLAEVVAMDANHGGGPSGYIPMRHLQKLEGAWGIPDYLYDSENGRDELPLKRIFGFCDNETYAADEEDSVEFLEGEIVLEVPGVYDVPGIEHSDNDESEDEMRLIIDYEGRMGFTPRRNLQRIPTAFGLLFNSGAMEEDTWKGLRAKGKVVEREKRRGGKKRERGDRNEASDDDDYNKPAPKKRKGGTGGRGGGGRGRRKKAREDDSDEDIPSTQKARTLGKFPKETSAEKEEAKPRSKSKSMSLNSKYQSTRD